MCLFHVNVSAFMLTQICYKVEHKRAYPSLEEMSRKAYGLLKNENCSRENSTLIDYSQTRVNSVFRCLQAKKISFRWHRTKTPFIPISNKIRNFYVI